MKTLRAGIIGTGMIGTVHARAVRAAGGTVAAVAASTPERAAAAASRLGVPLACESAAALVDDDAIDVVHVCTPNALHAPLAIRALHAGKDVVCEKPLGLDLEQAEEIAAAVRDSGRLLAVPFVYRFYPLVREARARVAAGALGAPRLLSGSYMQDWLADADATNWRVDAAGGGASRAFADIGSHWCDLLEFVSGQRIVELSARTHVAVPARGDGLPVQTEDVALVHFRTDAGAVGSVVVSQISHGRKNRLAFRVDGAAGSAAFDQELPDTLELGHAGGRVERLPREARLLAPEAARYCTLPPGHPQGYHDCFDAFVADAYEAIATRRAPDGLPTATDGVRAAQLVEAVLASARSGERVTVPLPPSAAEPPVG